MLMKTRPIETNPPDHGPSAEYLDAKREWKEIDAKHTEMRDRLGSMELALSLVNGGDDARVPKLLRDRAHPHLKSARKRPAKHAEKILELRDELEEFTPTWRGAREAWETAQRRETNRIAVSLQPRHRQAVNAIAAALEALSQAVADDHEVRAELKRRAPLAQSPNLPDLGSEFADVQICNWGSRAWQWARKVRAMGIIT